MWAVNCHQCQHPVQPGAVHCAHCGIKLQRFRLPRYILLIAGSVLAAVILGGGVWMATRSYHRDLGAQQYTSTGEPIVWVTKAGKRYHRENCDALTTTRMDVPLGEAKARGCTPCSRCGGTK